jgi:hypothetical protein
MGAQKEYKGIQKRYMGAQYNAWAFRKHYMGAQKQYMSIQNGRKAI